eukprot:2806198-Amphidinium_carterae.1
MQKLDATWKHFLREMVRRGIKLPDCCCDAVLRGATVLAISIGRAERRQRGVPAGKSIMESETVSIKAGSDSVAKAVTVRLYGCKKLPLGSCSFRVSLLAFSVHQCLFIGFQC